MAILDSIKRKLYGNQPTVESGSSGTSLFHGIIIEDFNSDLQFPKSVEVFDEMRKSDATVNATLEAIKKPILSAKWFFTPASEDEKDIEIAEFADYLLLEKLKWKCTLEQILTYQDFGFFYGEKVYQIDPLDRKYPNHVFFRLAPRIQSAHYKWDIMDLPWVDGHPAGITQMLPGKTDDQDDKDGYNNQPTIPWDKLILFTRKREGNNFEGVSVLRAAYKHFHYKDVLYRVSGISAERYGVGIPWAKLKAGASPATEAKIDELLDNLRANEQSRARLNSDVEDWGIMTPNGDAKAQAIQALINHHDRKIYDNILAGFLNLSAGDGGSNALSKDQSSFFLRSLMAEADYIKTIMQPHIDEIIRINFPDVEDTPQLTCTDIGTISMDEIINSIVAATTAGVIKIRPNDEDVIRGILKLPPAPVDDGENNEELQIMEQYEMELEPKGLLPDTYDLLKKSTDTEKKQIEEIEKNLAEVPRPNKRERDFLNNINQYERFLDDEFREFEKILAEFEVKYRKGLRAIYEASETERVDGVVSLKYDLKMVRKAEQFIDDLTKRFSQRIIDSPTQRRLFNGTRKMAVQTLKDNYKELNKKFADEIEVDEGQFRSMEAGYISNAKGVLFNEPRRMKESVVLNYGSGASLKLAIRQADGMSFNRNIYKLSTVTHARGAFQGVIYENAKKDGFTFYKVVVPPIRMKDVDPSGRTAALLFTIGTAAMINKRLNKQTDGQNSDAVKGLGIGHNTLEYYYPIESDMLDEEEEIAKAQRKEFFE